MYQKSPYWKSFKDLIEVHEYNAIIQSSANGIVEICSYTCDNELTTLAIADEHYHFVQWLDENTDNPRSFVVFQDTTLMAEFAPNLYNISASAGNGRVYGTGKYDYGTSATLIVVADKHYQFVQWSDGNTDNPRVVSVIGDTTYTAEFIIDQYPISTSAENGYVCGAGKYDYGTFATLTAIADEHYHFTQWSDGNTDNPRSVLINGGATYTAEFVIDQHTISASGENGCVYGVGKYDYGTFVTLTAMPDEHYFFTKWSDGNTDNPRIVSINGDATYTAEFAIEQFTISASAENGQVYGAGKYDYGTFATLTAMPDEHYHFTKWSDANTDNPRIVTIKGDASYTAEFTIDKHTISVVAINGRVEGNGTYDYGATITLMAIPDEHYYFLQWNDGNTDNPRTIYIDGEASYTADFAPHKYTISTLAENGSVEGTGVYDYGMNVILTAVPNRHYLFTQWSDGNIDNPRTVFVGGNATYDAEFSIDPNSLYTVMVSYDISCGVVTGGGDYNYGTQITLTAIPNSGYEFKQWSNGLTYNPYRFTVVSDLNLEAEFIPATAINDIQADTDTVTTPQKVLIDGQVYILRNGKTYTLTGVEVESL